MAAALSTVGASAHPNVVPPPVSNAPSAAFSTSGEYATDVLGDPWDFSNDEDVVPIPIIGTEGSFGISRDPSGVLMVDARNGSTVKLVRTWGATIPWGHDGVARPIDADTYTHLSMSVNFPGVRDIGVRYYNAAGQFNDVFSYNEPAGWHQMDIDLTQPGRFGPSFWSGTIVGLHLLVGGSRDGSPDRANMLLDWVRLHRADAPVAPPAAPIVRVISPSE